MIKTFEQGGLKGYFTEKSDGNFSFKRDPDVGRVRMNFINLAEALGLPADSFIGAEQTHGVNIGRAEITHCGTGIMRPVHFTETDGLITDKPGVVLTTTHADCVPVQLFDAEHGAVAAVHSGWKGTAHGIAKNAVRAMSQNYGTNPAALKAVIGPAICMDCFEISEDVYGIFAQMYPELITDPLYCRAGRAPGKYQLDLKRFVRRTLEEAGLVENNIHDVGLCTCCPGNFYSHRRGDRDGAQASVVYIEKRI